MIRYFKTQIKKNAFFLFLYRYVRYADYRYHYNSYIKNFPHKKSLRKIFEEKRLIKDYWKTPGFYYYRYKLYDKVLTKEELLDYIPPIYYYGPYWEKRHSGLDKSRYGSKFFQHELFKTHEIPALDIIATVEKRKVYNKQGNIITLNDLISIFLKKDSDLLFFKPEFGRGGNGIMVLSKEGESFFLNRNLVPFDNILDFFTDKERYLVQERFIQSETMSEICNDSVNTLRLYTKNNNGTIEMPAGILRMGVNKSYVDNFAQGGLISVINTKTGEIESFAQTNKVDRKFFRHPDTGFTFAYYRIENWGEIKKSIISFAEKLNECKDLGWDVAIGEDGIKILEINIQVGLDIQLIYGGLRRLFKVYPENQSSTE